MRSRIAAVIILLAAASALSGQEGFAFRRELSGAPEGWARIELPDNIYARLAPGFPDLRIFGADPSGKSTEVPYVLHQPSTRKQTEISFRLLNQSTARDRYFYTFDTASTNPINRIELRFAKPNFDRRVLLEGSQDLKEWQTVLEDYRILSVRNENTDFSFTSLRFPDAAYRYYRLSFQSGTDPGRLSASIFRVEANAGAMKDYPVDAFKAVTDDSKDVTTIDIRLKYKVPVSSVSISAQDGQDYYRPFDLSYRSGKDKTGRDLYSRAGSGVLNSLDTDPFDFPQVVTDALRISVRDGDNKPLKYGQPRVAGRPYEMLVKFPSPGDYELYYSNPNAKKPEYDLAHFADRAPAKMPTVPLGDEMVAAEAAETPTYGKWLLWAVMVAAAALMLRFAFGLLKRGR